MGRRERLQLRELLKATVTARVPKGLRKDYLQLSNEIQIVQTTYLVSVGSVQVVNQKNKGELMTPEKIISTIPIAKIFKLIGQLLKFSKGGISHDEAGLLLETLAEIASDVAIKASRS
jgi:hypothetical protein